MISDQHISKIFDDATREFRDSLEYQDLVSGRARAQPRPSARESRHGPPGAVYSDALR